MNGKKSKGAGARPAISSLGALATAVGRNRSTVTKWTRHPKWPFGPKPWPVATAAAAIVWAQATLQPDRSDPEAVDAMESPESSDSAEMRVAKLAILRERTRKLKIENDRDERLLIPRHEIEQPMAQLAGLLRSATERVQRQYGNAPAAIWNEAIDEWEAGWREFASDAKSVNARPAPLGRGADPTTEAAVDAPVC